MEKIDRRAAHRQRAIDSGSKRYTIVLGPEFVSIVQRQREIWGSDVEVMRQALLALETTTSAIANPEQVQTFAIEKDHVMTMEPLSGDRVKLTFQKGESH